MADKWLPTLRGGRKAPLEGRAVRTHEILYGEASPSDVGSHYPYVIELPQEILFMDGQFGHRVSLCGSVDKDGNVIGQLARVGPSPQNECTGECPADWDGSAQLTLLGWLLLLGLDLVLDIAPLPNAGYMVSWLTARQQAAV